MGSSESVSGSESDIRSLRALTEESKETQSLVKELCAYLARIKGVQLPSVDGFEDEDGIPNDRR
jgi:hypothetical protein